MKYISESLFTTESTSSDGKYRNRAEVFVIKNGKLIVGKTKSGDYHTAGGGVEFDETPEEAAKRECLEELGIALKNIKKIGPNQIIEFNGEKSIYAEDKSIIGFVNHFYVADFDKYDDKLYNDDGDGNKPIEVDIDSYIKFLNNKINKPNTRKYMKLWFHKEIELLKSL